MSRISAKFGTFAVCLFSLLVLAGMFAQQTFAQTVTSGDITGTVTDASGAVVVGAEVSLANLSEGTTQAATTNASGLYRFSFLKPGDYKLSIAAKGFKSGSEKITVGVGQVATANFKLELGAATEVVEVTGAAPLIQTENGDTSTTYDEIQLRALPAPGGDITSYAYTAPGVVVSNGAGYGNFSANGLPGTSNLFSVNGQNFNDPFLSLNNSGASNLLLGFNDVAEANVITNAYSGQYGQYAGAQVTYITKSGNNQFHGDAIWMWNGRALNADYEGVRVALPTATSLILAPSPQFQLRRCSRERRMYSRGMRTNFTVFLQTLAKAHVALGCNEGRSEALRQGMASGVFTPVQRRFTGMFWNVYNLAE